jgi:hypothetical protein
LKRVGRCGETILAAALLFLVAQRKLDVITVRNASSLGSDSGLFGAGTKRFSRFGVPDFMEPR